MGANPPASFGLGLKRGDRPVSILVPHQVRCPFRRGREDGESMETTIATPTARAPAEPASPLTLTPKAVEMVKDAMAREKLNGYGIRIGVVGGGCSGFQYSMDFENAQKDGDSVYEQEGVKLYVDPMSS